ncbi:MAG: hypothetical protein FWF01_02420 [Alphaproteobacteria bacterium]|nr:hypothetical protein [Alphaproteobacteria bacterium]
MENSILLPDKTIVIITGPSGSGKSKIVEHLTEDTAFAAHLSTTTRRPRPGEIDGVHYNFVTEKRFREKIENGKMLQYTTEATDNGDFYGSERSDIDHKLSLDKVKYVLCVLDHNGFVATRKAFPGQTFSFFINCPRGQVFARLMKRPGMSPNKASKRMGIYDRFLSVKDDYDEQIDNSDGMLPFAVGKIRTALKLYSNGVFNYLACRASAAQNNVSTLGRA